ncbi:SCO-spondin-like isoform X1 [Hydra vulgaris]|uniref:SCO-spondin-like isoform X1 n=1 Tax=Hydra vulgaris TaxID=6087 RepID=A0ABM4BWK9_HYDVU
MLIILVFVISISHISTTFITGLSHELFRFKDVFDMVKTQKQNVNYLKDPDYYKILDHFNATADSENFYGYRIHGWFHAPITGSYRFVNYCEQSFNLYISSDMDPAKKKLILKQVQSSQSSIKQFRVADMSSSVPVFMEENNIYYIEAIFPVMKPANCFSLGVRLPRQSDVVQPIQKEWLSPIRIETCISLDCEQPANEMCIFENKKYAICTCKSGYKILNKVVFCRENFFIGQDFVSQTNNQIASIRTIFKEFSVSFDIYPLFFDNVWQNVIHLTSAGNQERYGDRIPGVFPKNDSFYISSAINGSADNAFVYNNLFPLNTWSSIHISQKLFYAKYSYIIKLNKTTIFSTINTKAEDFQNVKVYASDPWHKTLKGFIRNLSISSGSTGGFQKGNNGYYYKFFDINMKWETAKQQCQIQGGRLATDENSDLQDILLKNKGKVYWIGASYDSIQAQWVWVNQVKVLGTRWKMGKPVITKQSGCLKIEKDLYWDNSDCKLLLPFLCQIGLWSDWNNWSSCSILCGDGVMVRTRLCGNTLYPIQCSHGALLNETKNCKIDCNGNWGNWGTWSTCSSTCESGISKRTRECNNTEYLCDGNKTEFKSCNNIQACKGDWETWSSWSLCSSSCNLGFTTRVRLCNSSKYLCEGNSTEIFGCLNKPCEGAWQKWNEWSSCNTTCGGGVLIRTRVCNDVLECPGNNVEYLRCYSNKTCQGSWQEWNEWSSCNTTCGQGFANRTRACSNDFLCLGNKIEYLKCYSNKTCQGAWQEWNEWSSCNTTCGEGFVNRTRACQHSFVCPGNKYEYLKCYSSKTCQGAWEEWNEWSSCNSTCGDGYVNRTRVCSDTFVCPGNKIEYLKCYSNKTCQGAWQEWNKWSSCNSTCGDGFVNRTRVCSDVFACPGNKVEFLKCYTNATCQGVWEKWNEWSSCNTTCGEGFVNRTRVCSDVFVCPGNKLEYLKCYSNETCQIKWSHWSKWENCNVSCGYGYKNRTRSCNRKNLFEWCSGESVETNQCFGNFTCERNWTNWSEWSMCNISCGYGFMNRTRVCNTTYTYEWCLGQSFENSICYSNQSCIVERQWSPWGGCSKTCGQGIMFRSLLKLTHTDEEVQETQNCSLIMCPVDGGWSEWGNFGPCSKTCGDGLMVRLRHCNKPLPRDGGLYCFGLNSDYRNCELDTICPVHGGWSDWTTWSQCNQPCNGGVMKRFRDCINPIPSSGGRECDGINKDVVSCNMHKCRSATINLVMYFPEEFYAHDYAKPNSKPSLILKEKIKYLMNKISEEHLAEKYFSVEIHSMKNITMN